MSFRSVMSAIGQGIGIGVKDAAKIESNPLVQSLESAFLPPTVIKLVADGLNAVSGASTIAAGAFANANLSGEQKMAIALAAFEKSYQDYVTTEGVSPDAAIPAKAQAILQNVFNLLDE